jgi:putative effector of murein hydrolase
MTEPNSDNTKVRIPQAPIALRVAAMLLRTAFIVMLAAVTLRVTVPPRETLFSTYVALGDLVRMALGLAVCVWLGMQLFKGLETVKDHWVWLCLGLVAVPLTLICLIAIW